MEGVSGGEEKEDDKDEDYAPDSEEETDVGSVESVTPDSEREKQDKPSPPGPNAKSERLAKDLAHLRALKTPGAGTDQSKAAHGRTGAAPQGQGLTSLLHPQPSLDLRIRTPLPSRLQIRRRF